MRRLIFFSPEAGGATPSPAAPAATPAASAPAPASFDASYFNAKLPPPRQPTMADIGVTDPKSPLTADQLTAWQHRQELHKAREGWRSDFQKRLVSPTKIGDIELPPMSPEQHRKLLDYVAERNQFGADPDAILTHFRHQEYAALLQERALKNAQQQQQSALDAKKMDQPTPDPGRKPPEGVDPKAFDAKAEYGKKIKDGHKLTPRDHMLAEGINMDKLLEEMLDGEESNPHAR